MPRTRKDGTVVRYLRRGCVLAWCEANSGRSLPVPVERALHELALAEARWAAIDNPVNSLQDGPTPQE